MINVSGVFDASERSAETTVSSGPLSGNWGRFSGFIQIEPLTIITEDSDGDELGCSIDLPDDDNNYTVIIESLDTEMEFFREDWNETSSSLSFTGTPFEARIFALFSFYIPPKDFNGFLSYRCSVFDNVLSLLG